MIIMALDHVRDFFSSAAQSFSPENLALTTPALFFTRWITHFCAPTFMFTAGIGASFWLRNGRTKSQLSRFLWSRGLWLILLELTVMRFALGFNMTYMPVLLLVFWALGGSMVALGFLVRLPIRALAVVSILAIVLHNLLDPIDATQFGSAAWLWNVLHQPGLFKAGGVPVVVGYPLVPWIFVMASGFCFGEVVVMEPERRRSWMLRVGAAMTAAFLTLRTINMYGDSVRWSGSVLSFLNCRKYPPSLDYLLMTLGPALLVLSYLDRFDFSSRNPLIVFGRVPFFFFVLHFYAIHILALLFAFVRYGHASFMLNPLPSMGGPKGLFPADYGYGLGVVYVVWIGVVAAFYPLCRWFAGVKERRKDWWLSYT
jgi:uncharacterized membrane protein